MKLSHPLQLLFLVCLLLSGFWYIISASTGLLLIIAAVVACKTIFARQTFQVYSLTKLMLAYLAWLFVVTFTSTVPNTSMMMLSILAGLPIMYLVASNMPSFTALWRQLRIIIFVIAIGFALLAIWQVRQHFNADGPLSDRNAFAAQTNLIWFPAVFLFVSAQIASKRWLTIMLGVGLFIISVALFATASRGGILTWALLLPFILWAVYKQTNSKKQILTVLTIAALAYASSALFLHSNISNRTFQLSNDASTSARLMIWQSTIKMAQAHPVVGTGWGTFVSYYPAYRSQLEYSTSGQYSHNDYLQFAAEGGILAMFFQIGLLLGVALQLFKCLKRNNDKANLEATALLLGVLAILIQASVNFIYYFAFINILAGLYLARSAQLIETPLSYKAPNFGQIRPSVKNLLAGFSLLFVATPYILNLVATISLSGNQPNQKLANFIVTLRPQESIAQLALLKPAVNFLNQQDISGLGDIETQQKLLNQTLQRLDYVRKQNALSPALGVKEVELLMLHHAMLDAEFKKGDTAYGLANQILADNLKANPYHVNSIILLSRLQLAQGNHSLALNTLQTNINKVLIHRDQQLVYVELLRLLAAPKVIAELDDIEQQLRAVSTKYQTNHQSANLPAGFYEAIDSKLNSIKNTIQQKS